MPRNPISSAFGAVFRTPSLLLAEVAWRWGFGIASWTLIFLTCREYLDSIRFTSADWALVRTRQPLLIAQAVADAIAGSGARLVKASIVVALGLVVFWILAASVGRAATLKALLAKQQKAGFGSLVGLNFLRAALALAAVVGFFGAVILAGYAAPVDLANPNDVLSRVVVFLAIGFVVGCFWSLLSWLLSIAPIFVQRDGRDTFGAIAESVAFFRRRAAPLTGVSLMFSGMRIMLIIFATLLAIVPFGSVQRGSDLIAGLWFVLGVTLVYCVAADVLYVIRLAAYVALAEEDLEPETQPVEDEPSAGAPAATVLPLAPAPDS